MLEPCRTHNPIVLTDLPMCTGADADVIAELPIIRIVLTFMLRLRVSRDFVMTQTGTRQFRLNIVLHIQRQLIIRHARRMTVKQGIRFNRHVIVGQMRRRERQRRHHIRAQLRHRLFRQSEHQIQIHLGKQRIRLFQRIFRLIGAVNAANSAQ